MYSKDYYDSVDYKPEKIGIEIFQKMSQYMPYMVFITRASDFKLLYANRKVSEFLGFNLDDLHNMDGRIGDMMDENDIDQLLDVAQKIQHIKDDQAIKIRVKMKGKEAQVVHLEVSISVFKRDKNGLPAEYFCVSEDVTEKILLEARTHEMEIITNTAEEAFRYGAWEWFPADDRVAWSKGIYDIFEKSSDLTIDYYLEMIHPEDIDNFNSVIEEACQTKSSFSIEYRIITHKKNIFYLREQGKPILNAKGEILKFIGSTADITNVKNIQKTLEAKVTELAKAYDEVEQFSYVASHDLQEPLRKISAFGERLKQKCGPQLDQDCGIYIDRIIDGTNRMRILIENLLMLSRTKRNTDYLQPTDLNEVLSDVLLDLENAITAKSAVVNYPKLPMIDAIPTQMHQLFLNLLTNSLKFTRENTEAVIDITCTKINEKQKDEYSLDTQQDYIYIQFRDNGIGFEPSYAETIFAPFKRLHGRSEYEGTGIGLAICKKVAQNHRGMIWAESSRGNGATFHIILAVQHPEMPSK